MATNSQPAAFQSSGSELLVVEDLKKHFPVTRGIIFQKQVGAVKAVDGVSFAVREGETSGSSASRAAGSPRWRAASAPARSHRGRVVFDGGHHQPLRAQLRPIRREMMMIFQDPYASLNARKRSASSSPRPSRCKLGTPAEVKRRVQELLERQPQPGALQPLSARVLRRPAPAHRRRAALAVNPKLIVCDEPVSALDVSCRLRS